MLGGDTTLLDAFKAANQVLQGAVQGIAELITRPGLINVDFADVRTVMSETGMAMMGSGAASGEEPGARGRRGRGVESRCSKTSTSPVHTASWSTLLPAWTCRSASSTIVGDTVKKFASDDATVVVGTVIDPEMKDQIRVTVVATGLGRPTVRHQQPNPASQPQMRSCSATVRARPLTGADYAALDKPTVQRQRAVGDGMRVDMNSDDLLDIPAFLRRQAD